MPWIFIFVGVFAGLVMPMSLAQETCSELPALGNGGISYSMSSRIVGTTASYSCNTGYTISGTTTRTCMSGGIWSGTAPTCTVVVVTCPPLTNPVNGQVDVPSRTAGSTATYSCDLGFAIVGVATRNCGSDGMWTPAAPTCAETCSELPALANGGISYSMSSRIVGTTASYSCSPGYTISTATTRTCMSGGTWSGTAPTCAATSPDVPTKLSIGATDYPHNSEVLITAVGRGGGGSDASLACFIPDTSTAVWYFPDGSVVPQGTSPAGPNEIITVRQTTAITLHRGGNVLSPGGRYCCGSPAIPESQRLCINLLVVCPSLSLPTNGMTITYNPPGSPTSQGTVATYQCITGYAPNPSTRTCQSDGTWSGGETTCQLVDCGPPLSIANGSPGTADRTTFGGTVTYTCDSGYQISLGVTMMTSSCQASRMWSTVTCTVVDCGPPPSIANGSPGTSDRTTFGGTVTYTCEDGLTISGQAMITCMANGMWSTPPSCPVPPVYLSVSSTNYFTNNPEILISSIGETDADALVCHTDLTTCCRDMDGETAGEWQFPNGTNIVSRFSSTPNDNYVRSRDTQLIRLHRRNNDMAVGLYCCVIPTSRGMEMFCANLVNSLTPTTRTAAPPSSTCPDLTVPANGMITYSLDVTNARPLGSTATYSCVNGYTINGDTTRTCQSDRTWSGGETTCDPPPAVLSLGSTNYLVNGPNIPLSSVGEGANSLACRTDLSTCCRGVDSSTMNDLGAWHYPNGSVVSSDSGDVYTTREGPMVVNLNRRDGVDGPTGLYCCVVPTSTGTRAVCAYLGSPLIQSDNTGAIVGGVVVICLALIVGLSITAIVIAYLVLRQRKAQGVNFKRDQPDILLTDKGQSTPIQTYDTVDTTCTYEEIDGTRPLKGNYDFTQNQAYAANTASLRGGGVVNTSGSGNPTGDSQVDGDEGKIYEN